MLTKHKPHAGHRKGRKMPFLSLVTLTFDLDLQTFYERGTKHVFRVNLAQIRSAVSETFHTQTKKQTDGVKNRTFRSSLRAVITFGIRPIKHVTFYCDKFDHVHTS